MGVSADGRENAPRERANHPKRMSQSISIGPIGSVDSTDDPARCDAHTPIRRRAHTLYF